MLLFQLLQGFLQPKDVVTRQGKDRRLRDFQSNSHPVAFPFQARSDTCTFDPYPPHRLGRCREGTQYAVSLDSLATEVHVFDGSVIWTPIESDADFEDRIISGEARRYLRSEPGRSHHIPFGQRQFVRRVEEAVREAGGGDLFACDGFENLAGQLRRGRSGFGWAAGWESAGRGRGPLAEVMDAPNDFVFGNDRSGRRLLSLRGGDNLHRGFLDGHQWQDWRHLSHGRRQRRQFVDWKADSSDNVDTVLGLVTPPSTFTITSPPVSPGCG